MNQAPNANRFQADDECPGLKGVGAPYAAGRRDRIDRGGAPPRRAGRGRPLRRLLLAGALVGLSAKAFAEPCPVADPGLFLDGKGHTARPGNALPSPPTNNDCGFYNWAWRTFMFVAQNTPSNDPAFLHYPKIEDVFPAAFGKKTALGAKTDAPETILSLGGGAIRPLRGQDRRPLHGISDFDDGVRQASFGDDGAILVDPRGNPIFYTINLNDDYANFIHDNRIDDIPRLLAKPVKDGDNGAIPADLEFRPGALEIKSSWMIVEGPVDAYANYIVAKARIPIFANVKDAATGTSHVAIDASKTPREVNVALLGLHVVGVIDGHPEFIWATFEHADDQGRRDLAPAAAANPEPGAIAAVPIADAARPYLLFRPGTRAEEADSRVDQPIRADQKFGEPTPVYRMFPGSQATKPPDGEAASPWEDPAVFNLNASVAALFDRRDPDKSDRRRNYRLVGAAWIDQPRAIAPAADAQGTPVASADGTETLVGADGKVQGGVGATIARNFDAGLTFGPDDPRLAGENRLSNMSLESFTQASDMAPHCFSCHNTAAQEVGLNGNILWARRINVSHVLTIAVKAYLARIQSSRATPAGGCDEKNHARCFANR